MSLKSLAESQRDGEIEGAANNALDIIKALGLDPLDAL